MPYIESSKENLLERKENPLKCLSVYTKIGSFKDYTKSKKEDRIERFIDYLEDLRAHSRYPNVRLWEKSDYAINLLNDLIENNPAFEFVTEKSEFVEDEDLFDYFYKSLDYLEYGNGSVDFSMNSAYKFLEDISESL